MQSETVVLPSQPNPTSATLFYERAATTGKHPLDFLNLIRNTMILDALPQADQLEEDYWTQLDAFRHAFAQSCAQKIGEIDALVDSPSLRGLHRPYLSAFKQQFPRTPWIRFKKTALVTADINNMDPLRQAVEIDNTGPYGATVRPATLRRLLIVDDVFATGATSAVIIEKLRVKHTPDDMQVFIACPLLIPASMMKKKGNNADDILPSDLPSNDPLDRI